MALTYRLRTRNAAAMKRIATTIPINARTSSLAAIARCTTSRMMPLNTAAPGSTRLSSRNLSFGATCAGTALPSTLSAGSSRPVCSPLRTMNRNSDVASTGLMATAANPMTVNIGSARIAFFTPSLSRTQGATNRLITSCTT